MSIYKILRDRHFQISNSEILRPGQIINGKILKIFPNNNAQIQLGNQVMIAQIEASLAEGKHYYFHVESTDDQIHLKVINQKKNGSEQVSIRELMNYLGLNINKSTTNLLQSLMDEKIPFEPQQMKNAHEILGSTRNKNIAQNILKYMISEKLPVSNSIFQAFYAIHTKQFSDQLHTFLSDLNEQSKITPLEKQLMNRISAMIGQSIDMRQTFIDQIIYETLNNDQQLFNLLQATGVIGQTSFSQWKSEWVQFIENQSPTVNYYHEPMPFHLNVEKLLDALFTLNANKSELKQTSELLLSKWSNVITHALAAQHTLSDIEFTRFKQEINQHLSPMIANIETYTFSRNFQNTKSQIEHILNILSILANDQSYSAIEGILLQVNPDDLSSLSVKDQFINHLKKTLFFTGLSNENLIMNDQFNQASSSIKSMLIQLMSQTDQSITDRAQPFIHFMNGLQLKSVHEVNNFIYASIQIPGEPFGLKSDVQLDFESKRDEDGMINPDYCRIMFYLDLKNLKETVIDMHIQNRFVSITIFNDETKIKDQCAILQPLLKKGLEGYQYELTSVSVKPFNQKSTLTKSTFVENNQMSYEGIDYRV